MLKLSVCHVGSSFRYIIVLNLNVLLLEMLNLRQKQTMLTLHSKICKGKKLKKKKISHYIIAM